MRAFQDEGHVGVLIVGDYTTRIGDPSGRSSERPVLTDEEIDANAQTLRRAGDDRSSTPSAPRCGSTASGWRSSTTRRSSGSRARSPSRGCSSATTSRSGSPRSEPISVSELLYPLMQAYDSVAVEADVELGGTDQLYNLLAGRDVMEAYGLEPQVVAHVRRCFVSWDGEKMSSVGREQHPADDAARGAVRAKAMRISDDAARRSGTGSSWSEPAPGGDPLEAKLALARVHRRALARRGGGAGRRRRTSRASCARERRPDEVPDGAAAGRRSRASAGAARRRVRDVDERGAAADRATGPSRSTARSSRELDLPARTARKCACSGREAPLRPLDTRLTVAIIPRLPERAAWKLSRRPGVPNRANRDGSRR